MDRNRSRIYLVWKRTKTMHEPNQIVIFFFRFYWMTILEFYLRKLWKCQQYWLNGMRLIIVTADKQSIPLYRLNLYRLELIFDFFIKILKCINHLEWLLLEYLNYLSKHSQRGFHLPKKKNKKQQTRVARESCSICSKDQRGIRSKSKSKSMEMKRITWNSLEPIMSNHSRSFDCTNTSAVDRTYGWKEGPTILQSQTGLYSIVHRRW